MGRRRRDTAGSGLAGPGCWNERSCGSLDLGHRNFGGISACAGRLSLRALRADGLGFYAHGSFEHSGGEKRPADRRLIKKRERKVTGENGFSEIGGVR